MKDDKKSRVIKVTKDNRGYILTSNSLAIQLRVNSLDELSEVSKAFSNYDVKFKFYIGG